MVSVDTSNPRPIDPVVRIGHVHLKVADLERALKREAANKAMI